MYDSLLKRTCNQHPQVSGGDCRGVLMNSGLPQAALAHLWGLVDIGKTGMLSRDQFALAMHLIEAKLQVEGGFWRRMKPDKALGVED